VKFRVAPLAPCLPLENVTGNRLEFAPRLLEFVGQPIDDGLQYVDEDGERIVRERFFGPAVLREGNERGRVDVADRHQLILGQDEADRIGAGLAAMDSIEDRHGHESGAVALIEPA
jgi:hypothetical protein